jgi:beta-glucanase (GH16 family)
LAAKNGELIPGAYRSKYLLNWQYAGSIMKDDVLLENGKLSLRNQKREIDGTSPSGRFHYSSGWIHTLHNMFYTYGYLEARIRMPLGSKGWPAFWMAQESLQWGAEFDIGEYFGTAFHKTCTDTNGTSIQGDVELLHKGSSFDDCCKKS